MCIRMHGQCFECYHSLVKYYSSKNMSNCVSESECTSTVELALVLLVKKFLERYLFVIIVLTVRRPTPVTSTSDALQETPREPKSSIYSSKLIILTKVKDVKVQVKVLNMNVYFTF